MNRNDLLHVLQMLYSQRRVSRTGLAERTGFAPSYISALVAELRRRNLVEEGEHSPSRAGRRRIMLHVVPELAYLAGIRVGRANTRIVVTDFLGKVLLLRKTPTEIWKGERHVLELVEGELGTVLEHDHSIKGIGIAISGVIDRESGTVLFWPKVPGWNDVRLKQMVENKCGLPVVVENSIRTMALAEEKFGEANGRRNFVYVAVSMGIGIPFLPGPHVPPLRKKPESDRVTARRGGGRLGRGHPGR